MIGCCRGDGIKRVEVEKGDRRRGGEGRKGMKGEGDISGIWRLIQE